MLLHAAMPAGTSPVLANVPGVHTDQVPTGTDRAQAFFQWLYAEYFERNPNAAGGIPAQWDGVFWSGPFLQLYALGLLMVVFFLVFARYFNTPHRRRLGYRLSRYDRITERHGRFGPFSILVTAATLGWALYYPVNHVLSGQVY